LEIGLLAKKGAKKILYELASGMSKKFIELKELVGSPTTTSQRLQELAKAGIIRRDVQADKYRTVMYSLTKRGAQIVELMKKIEGAG
jgi:DNA-binding HxlR family transcriptional regulator